MGNLLKNIKSKFFEKKAKKSEVFTFHPINKKEIYEKRNEFSVSAENFIYTPAGFVLKGVIYIIFLVIIAAVVYSVMAKIETKVASNFVVDGEEYLVQSPVDGSISAINVDVNDEIKDQRQIVTILSEGTLVTEANKAEMEDQLGQVKKQYGLVSYALNKLENLAKIYGARNDRFKIAFTADKKPIVPQPLDIYENGIVSDSEWVRSEYYHLIEKTSVQMNDLWAAYLRTLNLTQKQEKIYEEDKKLFDREVLTEYQLASSHQSYVNLLSTSEGYVNTYKVTVYTNFQNLLDQRNSLVNKFHEIRTQIEDTEILEDEVIIQDRLCMIMSKYPGIIAEIDVKPYQYVNKGLVLMKIIRNDLPKIGVTYITNQNIGKVKVGQSVYMKLDAYPYQDYGIQTGKIVSISPNSKLLDGIGYVYEARIVFDDTNPKIKLIYGMRGMAEISTGYKRMIETVFAPLSKVFDYLRGKESSNNDN